MQEKYKIVYKFEGKVTYSTVDKDEALSTIEYFKCSKVDDTTYQNEDGTITVKITEQEKHYAERNSKSSARTERTGKRTVDRRV